MTPLWSNREAGAQIRTGPGELRGGGAVVQAANTSTARARAAASFMAASCGQLGAGVKGHSPRAGEALPRQKQEDADGQPERAAEDWRAARAGRQIPERGHACASLHFSNQEVHRGSGSAITPL
jgi:hypothetical protein